jgi:SNF2 family DNA or RNA helicase
MLNEYNLHEYQRKAITFAKNNPKCALFLDLGLGKTVTTLTAIKDLLDSFDVNKVLVISPLRVTNTVWHKEIANWSHLKDLSYVIATGTERERIAALYKTVDITLINRENVPWLVKHYGAKFPFDMVVIDESSSFKNPSSQRFKALRKVTNKITRMIQLTATPSPNGLLDIWSQISLLDDGKRLGRTMTAYKSRFFESDYMGYKFNPREGSKETIYQLIEDITMTLKADDYLDMPDRIDSIIKVQLPTSIKKQYDDLEKDFLITINDDTITTTSAAALANKLLQFSNGAMYIDDLKNYQVLHDLKIEALKEIVEENPNENLLIAYNYKTDLIRLQEAFPKGIVLDKKGEAVDKWNNGDIKMLLAHPMSAGHGLNLQKGGSVIIWFGLNWSLELYQQFNGRVHRQGQEKPTRIIHIVADGCIDEKVMKAIELKAETQNDLLDRLKLIN